MAGRTVLKNTNGELFYHLSDLSDATLTESAFGEVKAFKWHYDRILNHKCECYPRVTQ